jgi:molybdopterin-guanine dinucleotide biosynthesis protein A
MSSETPLPPFTALLLAGGQSTRMGVDKAELIVGGQPMWQFQLAKLRALGPAEALISGNPGGPYSGAGVEIVPDTVHGLGPLAGITAALRFSHSALVLVLAIDLPAISTGLLGALIAKAAATGCGVVPQGVRGFEPLAAVYPRTALPEAEEFLHSAERSMQRYVRALIAAGKAGAYPLAPAQEAEFCNVNTPLEHARFLQSSHRAT